MDIKLLTTGEAAKILSIHKKTVRRWCANGTLRHTFAGTHRRIYVDSIAEMLGCPSSEVVAAARVLRHESIQRRLRARGLI